AVISGIAIVGGLAALWALFADKVSPKNRDSVVRTEDTAMVVERKPPVKSEASVTVPVSPAPKALVPIARFGHEQGRVRCARASPDGKQMLTGGMDRELRLWDLPSRRLIKTMKEESVETVSAVAFTPDGQKILTCRGATFREGGAVRGKDHRLSLWDTATGKL